ncbi:hypothetical protein ACP275_02G033000 [Erythranthe tilingii]
MIDRPWKGGGCCGIEVDGLELVLAPRGLKCARDEYDVDVDEESVNTTTIDKMVKSLVNTTIDKMVKSLVTEFDVKVKKLTVSFDPLQEEPGTVLVLRISEVSCVTNDCSYLRLSQRPIVLAYEGVVHVHHLRTGNTTRILSGENGGGLWGFLELVLPWKNGSLDIGKVHIEFFVSNQELRLQPSTIKCFVYMWDLYNDLCLCKSRRLLEKIAALEIRLSVEKRARSGLSGWAVQRSIETTIDAACCLVLRNKLSKFILGDIAISPFNVQLISGKIKFSGLALNVDNINEQLGPTAVLLKEGSVGTFKVTLPWCDYGNCRIEVDSLDLVLAPRRVKKVSPIDIDVDQESVKSTIDKIVKQVGTSFNIKVKNLSVAFDPLLEEEGQRGLGRILVFRIGEAECETRISREVTNSVKYQGVVLETLDIDQSSDFIPLVKNVEPFSPISGNLKVNLPLENGSLDIGKVEADLRVEPYQLTLSSSAIRCFVLMWESCKGASNKDSGDGLLLNKIKALQVQLAVEKRNARKWSVVISLLKFVFFVVVFLCVICIEFDTFGKKFYSCGF